jgi:hypothetical protein
LSHAPRKPHERCEFATALAKLSAAVDAKAIKRAALDADQTISDFMLACFHASMKNIWPLLKFEWVRV